MRSTVAERFSRWVAAETSPRAIARFRIAFAAIWLVYDAIDLFTGATAHQLDPVDPFPAAWALRGLQLVLVFGECALLLGVRPRTAALVCAGARAVVAWRFFPLNDFLYFSVTALLLALARSGGAMALGARAEERVPRWPRDLLVLQAAWIYFASGLLKLNPVWLSGGHLFVRLQYLGAARNWPYPHLFGRCAASLACESVLAWCGAGAEVLLAVLLAAGVRRRFVVPLAIGIHGFAAAALNVFFFGASMVAQVALLAPWGRGAEITSVRRKASAARSEA